MLYSFRNRLARARYDRGVRGILETPPLQIVPAPLTFCSMVSERDLLMYLVAIKSLYPRIGEGRIRVIDDGTLTPRGKETLRLHLGSPTIVPIASIDTGLCPLGGTWERLLHILDLTEDSYVIQVDSDLLARAAVSEVVECYRTNRSFTLGTHMGQRFTSLDEAAAAARASGGTHVQMVAEQALDRLLDAAQKRYVRGCSGFAGFARGSSPRHAAEEFSVAIQNIIGDRWNEWGSEQVTSNYIVSNSEQPIVLPISKYRNHTRDTEIEEISLLHFLGTDRFYGGRYLRASQSLISEVRRKNVNVNQQQ